MAATTYKIQVYVKRDARAARAAEARKEIPDERRTDLDARVTARTADAAMSATRELLRRAGYVVLGAQHAPEDTIIARIELRGAHAKAGAA